MNNGTIIVWGMTILLFITVVGIERNKKNATLRKK